MKTAVSIPDELYQRARWFADRRQTSPEDVLGEALEQYLDRHEHIAQATDRTLEDAGEPRPETGEPRPEGFIHRGGRRGGAEEILEE